MNAAAPSWENGQRVSGARRAKDDPIMLEYTRPQWRNVTRKNQLQRHPECELCGALAVLVDHKIPIRILSVVCRERNFFPMQRVPGFHIAANLRSLCASCHNQKTTTESHNPADYMAAIDELLSKFKPGIQLA